MSRALTLPLIDVGVIYAACSPGRPRSGDGNMIYPGLMLQGVDRWHDEGGGSDGAGAL